jgi:UDP-3-O-[3-hydroxymyristoyl] glucosamine N-acyltransferase
MKGYMKSAPKNTYPTVAELADFLGCPYIGNGDTVIRGISGLENAKKGDLVFLTKPKQQRFLEKTKASAVIIPAELDYDDLPAIKSKNPHRSFIRAIDFFFKPYRPEPEIHPQALVSPSAKLGKDVSIGAFSIIGDDTEIGDNTVVFPLVSIYPGAKVGSQCLIHSHTSLRENIRIGSQVIIHNGCVIGADGFGYLQDKDKSHIKIPQTGTVIIEDNVEIGANTTIDRAALGKTVIRKGTKIDNLVQVAHNVEIGENSILVAQAGIAGSSRAGKNVIMSGQVGISDHVNIGDNVIIAAKSGITKDIPEDSMVAGMPHLDIMEWRKAWSSIPKLYELIKEVRRLKKRVAELEKNS